MSFLTCDIWQFSFFHLDQKSWQRSLRKRSEWSFCCVVPKKDFSIRHATFSFILSKWLLPSAAATLHIWKSCFEAIKTYFKKWLTYHIDYFMLTFMWHLAVQQMHEEGLLSSMLLCTTVRFFNHTCFKTFNFLHSMNFAQRHWNDFAEKLQKSPHHHNCIASQKSQSSFCNDFLGIHSLLLWLVYIQGFIVTIYSLLVALD